MSDDPVDVETLKSSRSSFTGVVTRSLRRFQRMEDDDPSKFDLESLNDRLASLETTERRYFQVHDAICTEESDSHRREKEEELGDTFTENVETTRNILRRLIALKKIHELTTELDSTLNEMETRVGRDPDKDYSVAWGSYTARFDVFIAILQKSTIRTDHLARQAARDFKARYISLTTKETPRSPILTTTSSSSRSKTIQLPKIALPRFEGDLMQWGTFWSQFSAAVHANPDLTSSNKLAYLRDSIRDPDTKPLLYSGIEHDGHYDEVVELLHRRFDKKRIIHSTYCKVLSCDEPVKTTKADFNGLADSISHNLAGLKHTGQYELDAVLTSLNVTRLSKAMQTEWELHTKDTKSVPPIEEFVKFLRFRADALTTLKPSEPKYKPIEPKQEPHPRRHKAAIHSSTPQHSTHGCRYECQLCPGSKHPLYQCTIFNGMSIQQRGDHIRALKLCYNCLAPGHHTGECRSTARCRSCGGKHHTLVHRDRSSAPVTGEVASSNATPITSAISPMVNVVACDASSVSTNEPTALPSCLMMTTQVLVKGPGGRKTVARALLDSGASMSLISNRVAHSLNLPRQATTVNFTGAQATPLQVSQAISQVSLCPVASNTPSLSVTAAIVHKVTCDLPLQGASHVRDMPHIKPLALADPTFHLPGRVDLLLGCDLIPDIMLEGQIAGPKNAPMAIETVFGWAILGKYLPQGVTQTVNIISPTEVNPTDSILTRFWEVEEPPDSTSMFTPDEELVQQHYAESHVYKPDPGHYQVSLPRVKHHTTLGLSRPQALHRYLSNEKALVRKGNHEAFQAVIQEYLDLGHAEKIPSSDLTSAKEHYYLPMHGVIKESSTSTKLRVVFDASAKTSNHSSLNDTLHTGPTLHPTLDTILLRFRMHSVALSADISKMYRAVHLDPEDRDLHRFIWREQPTDPLSDFRMTRVTFGVSASPYLAIKTLQQTSHDFAHQYPIASPLVSNSFYVDDLLTGAATPEQAMLLHTELRSLLLKGGFDLRKWRSSSPLVLNSISPSLLETMPVQDLTGNEQSKYPKALGVEWDSAQDTMSTSLSLPTEVKSTKRGIISDVARTFDVLGWLAPTVVTMKILYQRVWEEKLAWDDPLPQPYVDEHSQWRQQLHLLSSRKQPRCYFAKSATRLTLQLHGFSDASTHAYAAVIYVRATYADHSPTCALVTAKTRVAPLKQLSIPRLELCGAALLAKLLSSVRRALNVPIEDIHAWCDSTIVLSWLDGNPKRFKTFVGNRLSTILTELPPSTWHHVPTSQNPADCASRGLSPGELLQHSLWWEGPPWLTSEPFAMPVQPLLGSDNTLELKAVCLSAVTVSPVWIEDRYNSYHTLIRVTAWCRRFVANLQASIRRQPLNRNNHLTTTEIEFSEQLLFRMAQSQTFSNELQCLSHDRPIKTSSALLPLTPFIDKHGIIRVGGRLSFSHLSHSHVHPVILSHKSRISHLMFVTKHVSLGHCGPSLILSATGNRVHIVGARRLSRAVHRSCVTCRRTTARTQSQMMGQLPASRTSLNPPFSICGVDYAGPFTLKKGHTRKPVLVKCYLAVFVCFSTKAAHLEIVSDASTEAFLACLKRFIARRGCPTEIHSDNGGNFVGAKRDLQELYRLLKDPNTISAISSYLLTERIQWHSTPERAPHFGGLWEAAVKSAKKHLRKIVGIQRMTYEEFATIAAQVEACLNSRPLTSITSHSTDGITTLTPSHFLILRTPRAYPEIPITSSPSLHRRWNMCQAMVSHFWRRWSAEYLQQLQKLQKWRRPSANLKVGDIVILRDDHTFTQQWPMAKVLETHPGQDGLVRVVTIKTATSTLKRPVTKLALLLSDSEDTASDTPAATELNVD